MTFIADRIAKELKTFGVTQAAVLDISKVFYRVWHIGLFNKFKLYGIMKRIYFIVSFLSSKRLWIVLRHKLSFKCTINDKISFKINFALNEQKKKKKKTLNETVCKSWHFKIKKELTKNRDIFEKIWFWRSNYNLKANSASYDSSYILSLVALRVALSAQVALLHRTSSGSDWCRTKTR